MKIDEGRINHNALRIISEMTSELYEFTDKDASIENIRLSVLGEIRGICVLAQALKDVLSS